jgi:hypothetical protein
MAYVNTAAAVTPAGTSTPLHLPVPAGVAQVGDCMRMTAWVRTTANANTKTISVQWQGASAALNITSAINNGLLQLHVDVFRDSATTMRVQNGYINGTTLSENITALLTCDFSVAGFFRTIGSGTAANDVINDVTRIEFLPSP